MAKLNTSRTFSLLRSSLCSLLLGSAAMTVVLPVVSSCGSPQTETGEPPAADAEMKVVILNVFGMT